MLAVQNEQGLLSALKDKDLPLLELMMSWTKETGMRFATVVNEQSSIEIEGNSVVDSQNESHREEDDNKVRQNIYGEYHCFWGRCASFC